MERIDRSDCTTLWSVEGKLGKYDLLERLATGGMAELFLARSSAKHGFEKTVVLKRILPAFAEQEDFIRMFMAEAQLAASLHHPNITQVFDFGEENGTFFFTMEYVAGRNLRQLLAAARKESASLPLGCALHIVVGVAAGLHHAHEHRDAENEPLQIVHRDVSPSNVIVTYEGNVKLVDFGIAKVAALGPATLSGSLKGKIAYMSPEQCRGELVDRRSDIFSLGTLLWELTTGRKLFSSNSNDLALLQKVEKAEVTPPSMVVPNYPSELEDIVLRAMSRDREKRYKTTLEMRMAIEEFAHTYRVPLTSTRVSSYMDSVFPRTDRRVVSMTSSMPSLRSLSGSQPAVPLKLAAVPSQQLASGPTKTVVAAHPNEVSSAPKAAASSAEDLSTGVDEVADTTGVGDEDPEQEKKAFPVWVAAAAVVALFGVGAYVVTSGDSDDEATQAEAAIVAEADPPTEPAAAAQPEEPEAVEAPAVALAEPEAAPSDAALPVAEEPAVAAPEEVPPSEAVQSDAQVADAPSSTDNRRSGQKRRSKRRRKADSSTAPAPLAEPTPEPAAATTAPKPKKTERKSDGVFLPSRNKKTSDAKPGKHKPSAKDFL